jgi:hypothetical protein
VLPLTASLETWVEAIEQQLSRNEEVPEFKRDWHEVAQEHEAIYREIYNLLAMSIPELRFKG